MLSERLAMAAQRKKALIFLVEGITDQISLEQYFSRFLAGYISRYHVFWGDITSSKETSAQNIVISVSEAVRKVIRTYRLKPSDIALAVQICDLDGVFIPDECICFDDEAEKPIYDTRCIRTDNVDGMVRRNQDKRAKLHKLMNTGTMLKDIPYRLYYMASNLEHVLYDKPNALLDEKRELADHFSRRFDEKAMDDFLRFICCSGFSVHGGYRESWKFAETGCNSLGRYTNLNLFFENFGDGTDLTGCYN